VRERERERERMKKSGEEKEWRREEKIGDGITV